MEHQQQPQNVSRQNFDDWMVPVYAPHTGRISGYWFVI